MLDRRLVERIAGALATDEGLVEKDWHVVRALGVLAALDHGGVQPAFSGGTSLSKGWGLIKRFSEDIDFKLAIPKAASVSKDHENRSRYRERILAALTAADFELVGDVMVRNKSRFFAADFAYPSLFGTGQGLRPHIRVEMSFQASALPPVERPIRSLIAQAQSHPPEVRGFPCIDPLETAADKLSALAWRVCTRQRGATDDDPTIIRHLHDLAALEGHVGTDARFILLVQQAAAADTGRGGGTAPATPQDRFAAMLDRLRGDKLWIADYDEFVRHVSFARPDEQISFAAALAATTRLVSAVCPTEPG
jgi:hypothetical protein